MGAEVAMITFIVPTIIRPSLSATLRSIQTMPGDEILIVGDGVTRKLESYKRHSEITLLDCPPGNDWGHAERNYAQTRAKCRYIAHIDDDDVYVPGARSLMGDAITKTPGKPILFRMQYPNGITLWDQPELRCGNVGTPMMLIPNRPTMLGTWGSFVGGDCHFLETSKWKPEEFVWRPEIVALLGHNT